MVSSDIADGVRRLKTLGERLKYARDLRGLRSNELNRLAGLNNSYVSSIETGRRKDVEAAPIQALARVLRVRAEWLTDGIEPMEGPPAPVTSKPNLERCLAKHPGRWTQHTVNCVRGFARDRPMAEWETVLDQLHAAISPVVAQNDR